MMAVTEAWQAGLFKKEHWGRNIVAGIVVGMVALPLAMAFAIASGVKPEQGIYTSILAGIIVALFGGSRVQIAGPTGAFVVILAAIAAQFGVDGLLLATLMAGIILVAFGLARFGSVLRFIPSPVIVGFTAGIGVVIFVGQWASFLGLPAVHAVHFHETLWLLVKSFPEFNPATALLGLLALTLVLYGSRIPGMSRVPGPLLAMVVVTILQSIFHFEGVATIASAFGEIPRAFPSLTLPELSAEKVILLLPAAFTIAMLGAIESLLSAVVADGMAGTQHDSNKELIGQGIANMVTPLFGGFAATGAIARTATNIKNGGNGPIAGVVHALTLLIVLLVLAPLAGQIPLTALAAILFVVAWNMSDIERVKHLLRFAPKADVVVLLVTFFVTVLVDLVVAVNVGVILAMMLFLRRMADSVEVLRVRQEELPEAIRGNLSADIHVYSINGPFFFAAVGSLMRIAPVMGDEARVFILRLSQVPLMDITGISALEDIIRQLEGHGKRVILCEAKQSILRKLVKANVVSRDQSLPRYYATIEMAIEAGMSKQV